MNFGLRVMLKKSIYIVFHEQSITSSYEYTF